MHFALKKIFPVLIPSQWLTETVRSDSDGNCGHVLPQLLSSRNTDVASCSWEGGETTTCLVPLLKGSPYQSLADMEDGVRLIEQSVLHSGLFPCILSLSRGILPCTTAGPAGACLPRGVCPGAAEPGMSSSALALACALIVPWPSCPFMGPPCPRA